jgi:hypothetical protein
VVIAAHFGKHNSFNYKTGCEISPCKGSPLDFYATHHLCQQAVGVRAAINHMPGFIVISAAVCE